MPGTRLPGYSKINARPNESRCSLLEKRITIFGVRSAAPSSSASTIGRPHRASGLALGLLDCQDDRNLALILIDRIAFSSSNFSVLPKFSALSTSKEGQYCGEPQRGPMSCFCFLHPAIVCYICEYHPAVGGVDWVEYIFSLIFDGGPLWHGSNIPLTHGLLSREMMATSA
jgi:hypothetical protein